MSFAPPSSSTRAKRRQARAIGWSHFRRLAFEPLEARRLLAVLTVNSLEDNVVADDGLVTLREAILAANTDTATDLQESGSGADEIRFASSLSGGSILLTAGELQITEAVAIDATMLTAGLTINAQRQSRVLHIAAKTGDFTIAGLTLTGGRTTEPQSPPELAALANGDDTIGGEGGAIRSLTDGVLDIIDSSIRGSRTESEFAAGGGIYARGNLTLTRSDVTGNHTQGDSAPGGGVFTLGDVRLVESTVSGNFTQGTHSRGGGIYALGSVELDRSHVRVNHTRGNFASGAGIADGDVEGGGSVSVLNSTVSGNFTVGSAAHGAGIAAWGPVLILHSDVIFNVAFHSAPIGGGIWTHDDAMEIVNSIVALNTAAGGSPDLRPGGALSVAFSLIGNNSGTLLAAAPVGSPDANGNLIGTAAATLDPLIGQHDDNGGPTITHALLEGSPAIDAGDPSAAAGIGNVPAFDQRGAGFPRVAGSRLDMGAFEVQVDDDSGGGGSEEPGSGGNDTNNGVAFALPSSESDSAEDAPLLAPPLLPAPDALPPFSFAAERTGFAESDGGSGGGFPLDEDNLGPRPYNDVERELREILSSARIATREEVLDAAYALGDIDRVSLVAFDMGDEPMMSPKKVEPVRSPGKTADRVVVNKPATDAALQEAVSWGPLAIWSALAGGGTLWMGGAWWWFGRARRRSPHELSTG